MSDLGLLSHQYHELTVLVRLLKRWAVQVKRALAASPPTISDELAQATAGLGQSVRFLHDVVGLADEGAWPEIWLSAPPLPTLLVERLRETHANDLPLYIKQLDRLADHLEQGVAHLSRTDVETLDGIVLAASADANAVFRRLMRWA